MARRPRRGGSCGRRLPRGSRRRGPWRARGRPSAPEPLGGATMYSGAGPGECSRSGAGPAVRSRAPPAAPAAVGGSGASAARAAGRGRAGAGGAGAQGLRRREPGGGSREPGRRDHSGPGPGLRVRGLGPRRPASPRVGPRPPAPGRGGCRRRGCGGAGRGRRERGRGCGAPASRGEPAARSVSFFFLPALLRPLLCRKV